MPSMEEFFTLDQATALEGAFSGIYSRISKVESADKSAQQIMLTLPSESTDLDSAIEIALQDYLEPILADRQFQVVPKDSLIAFSGTLSTARSLQGYQICDGTGNTPDLRNLFLRGAAEDADAGDEGGAASCTLTIAIPTHDTHVHSWTDVANTDACSCSCCFVPCSSGGVAASIPAHVHAENQSGNTGNVDPVSALTHNDCPITINTVPPYYTVIWLRKR